MMKEHKVPISREVFFSLRPGDKLVGVSGTGYTVLNIAPRPMAFCKICYWVRKGKEPGAERLMWVDAEANSGDFTGILGDDRKPLEDLQPPEAHVLKKAA